MKINIRFRMISTRNGAHYILKSRNDKRQAHGKIAFKEKNNKKQLSCYINLW